MTDELSNDVDSARWEQVAAEWIDWARAPGHDAFWAYRDEFRRFLPPPGRATLDLGCGEGRISRELRDLGHRVTATDLSPSLLAAAQQADSADKYICADASSLPFEDGSFDRVVAYNMLMDVADLSSAVAEARRVLAGDGVLTLSIVHPFSDRGSFEPDEPDEPDARAGTPFVVSGDYFEPERFDGVETRNGLVMHFSGWSRSLQDYVGALIDVGLVVTDLAEPRPAPGQKKFDQWSRIPLFLWLNARIG